MHAPLPRGAAHPLRRVRAAQDRYDPAAPDAFTTLVRDDSAFWYASRPFFGGHTSPPERRDSGQIGLDVDWRVLEADPRWRETIADLFASAAAALGAFYAEGWVEPGWEVSSNNRLWTSSPPEDARVGARPRRLAGPAGEPAWLTWFGGDYREPVAAALADGRAAPPPAAPAIAPTVDARPEGTFVRLGEPPRAKLAAPPPPAGAAQAGLSSRSRSAVKPGVGDRGRLHPHDLDALARREAGDRAEHRQPVVAVRRA